VVAVGAPSDRRTVVNPAVFDAPRWAQVRLTGSAGATTSEVEMTHPHLDRAIALCGPQQPDGVGRPCAPAR